MEDATLIPIDFKALNVRNGEGLTYLLFILWSAEACNVSECKNKYLHWLIGQSFF